MKKQEKDLEQQDESMSKIFQMRNDPIRVISFRNLHNIEEILKSKNKIYIKRTKYQDETLHREGRIEREYQ